MTITTTVKTSIQEKQPKSLPKLMINIDTGNVALVNLRNEAILLYVANDTYGYGATRIGNIFEMFPKDWIDFDDGELTLKNKKD